MALQILPDGPSSGMSPNRISFSHDLLQNDVVPIEPYVRSSSPVDFDFCVLRDSLDQIQPSSADELFSGGKILPIEIRRTPYPPPLPPPPLPQIPKATEPRVPISDKSSFWRFKRSSSLNCGGGGYARNLCPLPRSYSTGSSEKRPAGWNSQKQSLLKYSSSSSSSSSSNSSKPSSSIGHQKPPLKKNSHGYYSNGVRVSPILNVPPANMFGLGFIFSGGKDKGRKK